MLFVKNVKIYLLKLKTDFVNKIISKFRNSNLENIHEKVLNEKESRITKLFFLLQFWRTSECDSSLKLSLSLKEKLRKKILVADNTELEDIPLSITYLETVRDLDDPNHGNNYKTLNIISIKEGSNPCAIIMNDFVIQLYEDVQFPFLHFYGINNLGNYKDYINYNQPTLKVRIISNERRKAILKVYFSLAAKSFMGNHAWFFLETFTQQFRKLPSTYQIQHYLAEISKDKNIMKFTTDNLTSNILKYFKRNY